MAAILFSLSRLTIAQVNGRFLILLIATPILGSNVTVQIPKLSSRISDGVCQGQGYYFSKPLSSEDAFHLLEGEFTGRPVLSSHQQANPSTQTIAA